VANDGILGRMLAIQLEGDPFPVNVDHRRVELMKERGQQQMATTAAANKPANAREARAMAKELGIEGWEDLGREDLLSAIATAQKGSSAAAPTKAPAAKKASGAKKAPAKKAATKRAPAKAKAPTKKASGGRANPDPDDPIPFRPGTNLYEIAKALLKGGKRSVLVKHLKPRLSFNPRKQSAKDFDTDAEIDRRLKVIGYILKNQHGWTYASNGRGPDALIQATPPGTENKVAAK
jgi:hypothetical protein